MIRSISSHKKAVGDGGRVVLILTLLVSSFVCLVEKKKTKTFYAAKIVSTQQPSFKFDSTKRAHIVPNRFIIRARKKPRKTSEIPCYFGSLS